MSTQEPSALNFLYEGEDDFRVLPTFGTITVMSSLFSSSALREQMEKLNADPTRVSVINLLFYFSAFYVLA